MDPAAAQQYMEAAALQAVQDGVPQLQMDAAAIQAAAAQLEAIQAALQQAGTSLATDQAAVAALEHLQHAKPEDYYANLIGAAAGMPDGNSHHMHGGDMQGDMDGMDGNQAAGDKPLTSRFRGVCWNKKNRRWQAAINSSGKYIYLGSFVQEEEAARAFDRAAIRLRGNRAKLNYSLADYTDESGNLVDDPRLSQHLQNVLGKEGGKSGKSAAMEGDHHHMHSLLGNVAAHQNLLYGSNLAQHILTQGMKSPHYPYSGAQRHNYGVLEVPDGCSLIAHIPGDEEAFAVLYIGPTIPHGGAGASVWDGSGAIDLGVFDTDKDARQAAGAVLKLTMFHKHTLLSTLTSHTDQAAAQQSVANVAAQYGMLLNADAGGAGGDAGDAAAMAAAAAAAAASVAQPGDAAALTQLGLAMSGAGADTSSQYKELFSWLAAFGSAQRGGLKPDEAPALDGGLQQLEAAAAAQVDAESMMAGSLEAMAAMVAAAGSLKNVRDGQEGGVEGQGREGEEGGAKRARVEDGMGQVSKLSNLKLQDVMKTLFEPGSQPGAQQGL